MSDAAKDANEWEASMLVADTWYEAGTCVLCPKTTTERREANFQGGWVFMCGDHSAPAHCLSLPPIEIVTTMHRHGIPNEQWQRRNEEGLEPRQEAGDEGRFSSQGSSQKAGNQEQHQNPLRRFYPHAWGRNYRGQR